MRDYTIQGENHCTCSAKGKRNIWHKSKRDRGAKRGGRRFSDLVNLIYLRVGHVKFLKPVEQDILPALQLWDFPG